MGPVLAMRHSRRLFHSATALHKVFVNKALQPELARQPTQVLRRPVLHLHPPTQLCAAPGRRTYASRDLPQDWDIKSKYVLLRNPDGGLSEPQLLGHVLGAINTDTQVLQALYIPQGRAEEAQGGGDNAEQEMDDISAAALDRRRLPVCAVVDREQVRNAQEGVVKERRIKNKEMELNWAIGPHDLNYKLKQVQKFLKKGMRVEIILLRKKAAKRQSRKQAEPDEAEKMYEQVQAAINEIKGTTSYKKTEGDVGGTLRMFVQGPKNYVEPLPPPPPSMEKEAPQPMAMPVEEQESTAEPGGTPEEESTGSVRVPS
jgi:translation initiation factor IF-3